MSKLHLIKLLAKKKQNLRIDELSNIINLIFDSMSKGLTLNNRIEIRGFGSIFLRKRKGRNNARDPRTGELISVTDRYIPSFRIGKFFFDKINQKK